MSKRIVITAALALALALPAAARPIELTDYLSWKYAGGAQISPDGKRIVYRLTRTDPKTDDETSELRIMDADGGHDRPFGKGGSQKWSPAGDRLAYVASDGKASQIHVRDMKAAEAKADAITKGSLSPGQLSWSPDGKAIAFIGRVPAEPDDLRISLAGKPEGAKWADDASVIGAPLRVAAKRRGALARARATG
jgi:acylaminoacyl-peptidase